MHNKIYFIVFSVLFLLNTATAEEKKTKVTKKTEKKVYYYPKAKKPVALGSERYEKTYKTLKGLKAVYINLDSYLKGSKSRKMKIPFDMKKKVTEILKKHNIKLLTKDSIKWKFGQPTINISPSFPSFLGPYKKGEKKKNYNPKCCRASVSASLKEGVTLLRQPDVNMRLTTWSSSEGTGDCTKLETWFPKAVIKIVEKLVKDKVKAEKKKTVAKKDKPKKKIVYQKPVKKTEVKKPITVKKKVVSSTPKYASRGSYAYVPNEKTVTVEKKLVKQKKNVLDSNRNISYQRVHITPKVVEKFIPVITQPMVVQKELTCANNTGNIIMGGQELYRQVITYERVASQKSIIVEEVNKPTGCDKAITMEMEIFRTGSSHISSSNYFILDALINKIEGCQNYKYVIETHADQRGSHEYNDKLTKERAIAISSYLQNRGISLRRFETQSFGKRRPVNFGTSVNEYSKNRRVVMTPYKIKSN